MDDFRKALNEVIVTWSNLSKEWDKIEAEHSDKITVKYPFEKDFREIIRDLIEWRENLLNIDQKQP